MKRLTLILVLVLFGAGCDSETNNQKKENAAEFQAAKSFKTKSGKTIIVNETHPDGVSQSILAISTVGFENEMNDTLKDLDPITDIFLTDLDDNGFDEIYIITQSVGSGGYGNVIGYASNRDKSMSMIYFPVVADLGHANKMLFAGYRGHDSFRFENEKLFRSFPIYNEEDTNANHTGGTLTVLYGLYAGEASWQLRIEDFELEE